MQHGVVRHQRQVNVLRRTTHVVQSEIKNLKSSFAKASIHPDMGFGEICRFCHVLWQRTKMTLTLSFNNNIMMKQDTRIRDEVMRSDSEPLSKQVESSVIREFVTSSRPPWHYRSASDVAIHLYRSACASFLVGTASFCLPSTTMIASQPVSFLAVMRSFFRVTCTRLSLPLATEEHTTS